MADTAASAAVAMADALHGIGEQGEQGGGVTRAGGPVSVGGGWVWWGGGGVLGGGGCCFGWAGWPGGGRDGRFRLGCHFLLFWYFFSVISFVIKFCHLSIFAKCGRWPIIFVMPQKIWAQ